VKIVESIPILVGDADCDSVLRHIGYPEYVCTLTNGHTGPHAAHAKDSKVPVAMWEDEE
jgi:hypothetical protein